MTHLHKVKPSHLSADTHHEYMARDFALNLSCFHFMLLQFLDVVNAHVDVLTCTCDEWSCCLSCCPDIG